MSARGRNVGRNSVLPVGLPAPLSSAVDVWSDYADGRVSNVVKAQGFVRFALRVDAETGLRIVEPRHWVIDFPLREQGRQKHQTALFTIRVVREEEISRDASTQGSVANHLRFKPAAERKLISGADEYVEFELLSREHEMPSQQPLRISMGPVRANKQSGQQEFVRVDMGQCIQRIATDVLEDSTEDGTPDGRLVQHRWWMCIETLRLLCNVDHIDCTALDKVGVPPQQWVIRLMDAHAPINRKEELKVKTEDRDIDDLMQFIDSRGSGRGASGGTNGVSAAGAVKSKFGKPKKKKVGKEKGEAGEAGEDAAWAVDSALAPSSGEAKSAGGSASGGEPASAASSGRAVACGKSGSDAGDGGSSPPLSTAASTSAAPLANLPAPVPSSQDSIDVDLMGELLARYRRLQERSSRAEIDAKISVVRDLLEVVDELEHLDAENQEDTVSSRKLFSAARKFEAKLRGLGLERVEALGKPFDRELHRMVSETPPSEEASQVYTQVVVEELESGWVLGKDLVRPALVTLG